MKRLQFGVLALLVLSWPGIHAQPQGGQPGTLYQISTLDALLAGDYGGRATFGELRRHGDFGLGTFDGLDGEMVAVDGRFYQVRFDGVATPVRSREKTPFSAVTFFDPEEAFEVTGETGCADLHTLLQERFPSAGVPYAIRITGRFRNLTTRSVPAQEKPWPPLIDALQEQVAFDLADVYATLAGFWVPTFLGEVNVAGFHFHAITADATTGGHVLDCRSTEVLVEIDRLDALEIEFAEGERRQRPMHGHAPGERPRRHWPATSHW